MLGLYDIGPKDDFDEIARVLGDDDWKWSNAHRIFKEVKGKSKKFPGG